MTVPVNEARVAPSWIPFSARPGLVWPALPPDPGQAILAAQFQLDLSQWLHPQAIVAGQFRQLHRLARFALKRVPHYRDHLARAGLAEAAALDPQSFLAWPLLAKPDVQRNPAGLLAPGLPESHGGLHWTATSGSTGHPLRAACSGLGLFFQRALQLRAHLWYGLNPRDKFAIIRAASPEAVNPNWGTPHNLAFHTGPSVTISSLEDHGRQLDWLRGEAPAILMANNTNLRALLDMSIRFDLAPTGVRTVIGFADIAAPHLRAALRSHWNARYYDTYGCNEMGTLALQCPLHGHMHVQSEHVLLEILRPDGLPCTTGEIGRVVVTDLHNFAMPLIRYDLGDQASFGPPCPCPCGRGLPTLQMIAGRTHDLAVDPTGRRFFVHGSPGFWVSAAQILQRQVVQHAAHSLEVRYVAERTLSTAETAHLASGLRTAMRFDYDIAFTRVPEIAPGPGGKFVDFVSLMRGIGAPVPP